jgi:hypothetical protein
MDPSDEAGRLAPPTARLLLEKHVSGRYVRCLVCGPKVLAAIEITKAGPTKLLQLGSELHEGFETVVRKAAGVIPGLATASVDLVITDPALDPDRQRFYIVELCERSWFGSYMDASPELGGVLADAVLTYEADQASVAIREPARKIALRIRAEGLSRPTEIVSPFRNACNSAGIIERSSCADDVEGSLEAHLQGHPRAIALVLEALLSGVHFGQRATAVDETQVSIS